MAATLKLTASSPPQSFTEPLTLAEVKKFLNLPDQRSPIDTAEDAELTAMIASAREVAELHQHRDLVVKQWDLTLDYFPCDQIALRPSLVSVDLVQYTDSTGTVTALTPTTEYISDTSKDPGLVMPPYGESWPSFTPWPSSAVLIRFTAGLSNTDPFWSDAGQRVLIGMRMLISAWFNGRLPYEPGLNMLEYPWTITQCLSAGSVPMV